MQIADLLYPVSKDIRSGSILELCPEGPILRIVRVLALLKELMRAGRTLGRINEEH